MELLQNLLISIFGGSGVAWIFLRLYVKDIARAVIREEITSQLAAYTTKEQMQIERKELLEDVQKSFLSIIAFRQYEKRIEENFNTINRRLADSSKRFDKVDAGLEHITDLLIKRG